MKTNKLCSNDSATTHHSIELVKKAPRTLVLIIQRLSASVPAALLVSEL